MIASLTIHLALAIAASVPQEPAVQEPAVQEPTGQETPPVPKVLALVGATLHTMVPGSEPAPGTLLVSQGLLEVLAPEAPLPEGALKIDITDMHVVPGLIDAMVNHDVEHDALYLASGVTLVRDTGNTLQTVLEERVTPMRDRVPGPALYVSGRILDGSTAATTEAFVLEDAEKARVGLKRLFTLLQQQAVEQGLEPDAFRLDFLSFHTGLGTEAWREVVKLGREDLDIQVWGPVPASVQLKDVVQAGQHGVFGMNGLLPPGRGWHDVQLKDLQSGLDALAGSEVMLTPMLTTYSRMLAQYPDAEEQLANLSPHYEVTWRNQARAWEVANANGSMVGMIQNALAVQRDCVRWLHEHGVTLVPGSGSPNAWLYPGAGLMDELDQWVAAGISSQEVLRMATAGAADALGIGDERGHLVTGAVADLVVLGTDPRRSLRVLRDPEMVVVRGRLLEREDLEDLVDEITAQQKLAREVLSAPMVIAMPDHPEGTVILSGYAENKANGMRISAERFCVVRHEDGRTSYCTRLVVPPTLTSPQNVVQLVQTFEGDRLQLFLLSSTPQVDEPDPNGEPDTGLTPQVTVEGLRIGESSIMQVRQKTEFGYLAGKRARNAIALVDFSDVLTALILGQHQAEGVFYALTFEGHTFEPVDDRWQMLLRDSDKSLHVKTSRGRIIFGLGGKGVPFEFARLVGNAQTDLTVLEIDTHGGPGLPPAENRRGK